MTDGDSCGRCGEENGRVSSIGHFLRSFSWFDWLLVLATAVYVWLLASRRIEFGSTKGNWVYRYYSNLDVRTLLGSLALGVGLGCLLSFSLKHIDRHRILLPLCWLVLGTAGQLLLRLFSPYSLGSIVEGDAANGFYGASFACDPGGLLRDASSIYALFPIHIPTNMPGKVLFFHLLRLGADSPQAMGLLIVLISNAGGLLLYDLVRRVFRDRRASLTAFVFYLFIPARLYFIPILNAVSPVLLLAVMDVFAVFLQHRRTWEAALLGIGIYMMVFFEPTPLAGGLFGLVFLRDAAAKPGWRRECFFRLLCAAALGFLFVHVCFLRAFGFHIVEQVFALLQECAKCNVALHRPMAVWLGPNLVEFFLNGGVAASILFFSGIVVALRRKRGSDRRRADAPPGPPPPPMDTEILLSAALLVAAGILAIISRGEVARVWIFLSAFLQISAAIQAGRTPGTRTATVALTSAVVQAGTTLSMIGFVIP